MLVSKSTEPTKLNNKATNAKLESAITQLHKLSNMTNKVTQTNQPRKGATSILYKQEGNQQATQAI